MLKSALLLSLAGLSTFTTAAPFKRGASGKRGVAFNDASVTKLFPTNGQFSWCYNWEATPKGGVADGLEYVPMLHSTEDVFTSGWDAFVDEAVGNGAKHLLSFNEPDQCGGGGTCMNDVGTAVAAHKQWVQPMAEKHPNVKIGAPAVTNGGAPMGLAYLKSFLQQCDGCKIDFAVAHWYSPGDVQGFKDYLNKFHDEVNMPVWVTEFAPTSGDIEGFVKEVTAWMDGQDWIERYAYHMAAPGVLVDGGSTGLSALGNVYASA